MPFAGGAELWNGPPAWHRLTDRVSAIRTAHAEPLAAEGRRLPIGSPPDPGELPAPLVARPRYALHARGVLLAGQRAILDPDAAHLFNDTFLLPKPWFDVSAALSSFPQEYKATPALVRDGESLGLADVEPIRITEPVVVLGSTESRNYGSWLFRILPKLLLLDELPETAGRALLAPQEQPWMVEIVARFAPGRNIVAHDITRVYALDDAIVPSLAAQSNILGAPLRRRLADLAPAAGAAPHRRLYVSRRAFNAAVPRRVMRNESELVAALQTLGFEEISPESMPLAERMAAFAEAAVIVGPSGSGMFNAVFASPAAAVLELEPTDTWRPMHSALYRSLVLPHAFLRLSTIFDGAAPAHPDWGIDVAEARKAALLMAEIGRSRL